MELEGWLILWVIITFLILWVFFIAKDDNT